MPLKEKQIQNQQSQQKRKFSEVPADLNLGLQVFLSPRFPDASNVCCCCARVAGNQIARSNGAVKVGALGQMLPLITGSEDRRMSAWCSCTPSDELPLTRSYFQGPAGVDSLYGTPRNRRISKNVQDSDPLLVHLNSWKPKQQKGEVANQHSRWQAYRRNHDSLTQSRNKHTQCHNRDNRYREHPGGSGAKDLHSYSFSPWLEVA